MSAFTDISAALDTLAATLAYPIAWENKDFTPETNTLYLRVTMLPASTEQAGVIDSDVHIGIYQIDVIAPMGVGKGEAMEVADIVADKFTRDQVIVENGVKVWILSTSRAKGMRSESWYILHIEVIFKAYTDIR